MSSLNIMKSFILSALMLCTLGVQAQTKLLFFGQKPTDKVSATPYGANDRAGHYVQADDAKLYYEVYGEGEPILTPVRDKKVE